MKTILEMARDAEKDERLSSGALYGRLADEIGRLRSHIGAIARHLEILGGNIPPPNPHTPELIMLAQIMRYEATKGERGYLEDDVEYHRADAKCAWRMAHENRNEIERLQAVLRSICELHDTNTDADTDMTLELIGKEAREATSSYVSDRKADNKVGSETSRGPLGLD